MKATKTSTNLRRKDGGPAHRQIEESRETQRHFGLLQRVLFCSYYSQALPFPVKKPRALGHESPASNACLVESLHHLTVRSEALSPLVWLVRWVAVYLEIENAAQYKTPKMPIRRGGGGLRGAFFLSRAVRMRRTAQLPHRRPRASRHTNEVGYDSSFQGTVLL